MCIPRAVRSDALEQFRARRVLIVDAEAALHAAAISILERANINVDHAPDLPAAMLSLKENAYDAVLIDAGSTKCEGTDLVRLMQPLDPRPVLVLAANDMNVADPSLVSLIVRKPYDVQMVIGVLLACGTSSVPPPMLDITE